MTTDILTGVDTQISNAPRRPPSNIYMKIRLLKWQLNREINNQEKNMSPEVVLEPLISVE